MRRQNGVTDDGKVSLEHIECNAACDYAPVVMVNWEFFDNQTPESARTARRLAAGRRAGRKADPTGAVVGLHLARRPSACSPASPTAGRTRVGAGPAGPASLTAMRRRLPRRWPERSQRDEASA